MWEAIPYITGGLTLIGFLVATAAWLYKRKVDERERVILAVKEERRAELVRDALEFFRVDTAGLTPQQQYELALAQIRARSHRHSQTSLVTLAFATLLTVVSGIAIARLDQPESSGAEAPPVISQSFNRIIGDDSSCSEQNVTRTFELCLDSSYRVSHWTEDYRSFRNGSAFVERDPSRANCVLLNLRYSDSGRDAAGNCGGHGWVNYDVHLNGRRVD